MNRTPAQHLRGLLGEAIPAGGTDADTMFTDEEIEDFLELGHDEVRAAAYYGWEEKAANFANMVTVNEGNAMRELTELHTHARRMMDHYVGYVPTAGRGRVQIGRIVRER